MNCDQARESISDALDDRSTPPPAVDVHLADCDSCANWRERAHTLTRSTMRPVEDNEIGQVTTGSLPRNFDRNRWIRVALAWAGVLLIAWNITGVITGGGEPAATHLARHQSAVAVALGVSFLFVAWRPDRAYGLVPFAATFTIALTITAIVDVIRGTSTPAAESPHLIEIAGLALLWILGAIQGPGRTKA